ncbi:hypothetical protein [Vibrio japonicus]|uniref:DUF2956 domain-containing protein n=1 Tax=Vibrio japonicus TaxID=1824638 RepID=A0ABY5LLK9_9VIBR|nr:hypothetical protein [Vibrio japonicus]UUM32984.1 hypothetical protein NP165_15650 [Vibrio japonicus]
MAVAPKHSDHRTGYDPSQDMTPEQLHRFGKVAHKAQKHRDKVAAKRSILSAAKDAAFQPVIRPKKAKSHTVRYAIWMIVVLIVSLWLMHFAA